jgi:hypothetical protein
VFDGTFLAQGISLFRVLINCLLVARFSNHTIGHIAVASYLRRRPSQTLLHQFTMGSAGSRPADYESEARGITVMLIVLTTVAIISRLISRSLQRVKVSADDYLMYIGYVSTHMYGLWIVTDNVQICNLGLLITVLLGKRRAYPNHGLNRH